MIQGIYDAPSVYESNDPENPTDTDSVTINEENKTVIKTSVKEITKKNIIGDTLCIEDIIVTNTGTQKVVIDSVVLSLADSSIINPYINKRIPLEPNQKETLHIGFAPKEVDIIHTDVLIYSEGEIVNTVTLYAVGMESFPSFEITPSRINLSVKRGEYIETSFWIKNTEENKDFPFEVLYYDSIATAEDSWISADKHYDTLTSRDSIEILISIDATTLKAGNHQLYYLIGERDFAGSYKTLTIDIEVINVAEISLSTDSLIFVCVPNETQELKYIIENIGIKNLYTTSQIQNNSAPFSLDDRFKKTEPGVIDTIYVTFAPSEEGIYKTQIQVESNDPSKEYTLIQIVGTAIIPRDYNYSLSLENGTLNVDVNASIEKEIYFTNNGSTELSYEFLETEDYPMLSFENSKASIAPQESSTIKLSFDATDIEPGEYNINLKMIVTEMDSSRLVTFPLLFNVLPRCESQHIFIDSTICEGNDIVFFQDTLSEMGEFSKTLVSENGCDSIVTMNLIIQGWSDGDSWIPSCEDTYTWYDGREYPVPGYYSYTDDKNCVFNTLYLTRIFPAQSNDTISSCGVYEWNGEIYTESGDYSITFTSDSENKCDSIATLHLTIEEPQAGFDTITACGEFEWNGEIYTQSGEYTKTVSSQNGCDSIATLILTIQEHYDGDTWIQSCGSYTWFDGNEYTVSGVYEYFDEENCASNHLYLEILTPLHSYDTVTACGEFEWNGEFYSESGEYTKTFTSENGCDSIATLILTIQEHYDGDTWIQSCESYTWFDGNEYTVSGVYEYFDEENCASNHLYLEILTPIHSYDTVTACDEFEWNGEFYSESGEYTKTFTSENGCDSIATLILTINEHSDGDSWVQSCGSYTWYNGIEYTAPGEYEYFDEKSCALNYLFLEILRPVHSYDTVTACDEFEWNDETYTQSGEYTVVIPSNNEDACSTIATLYLTIVNSKIGYDTITSCGEYLWNKKVYTQSGEYTNILETAQGCDSIVNLHLTINPPAFSEENIETCGTFEWNDILYAESGSYTRIFEREGNCDSAATLHLTILPPSTSSDTVVSCGSYVWNNIEYFESGKYIDTLQGTNGCDSLAILHLTIENDIHTDTTATSCDSFSWYGIVYTESGTYTKNLKNYNGCDSTVSLHLKVNKSYSQVKEIETCNAITIDGETYNKSGEYVRILHSAEGCDSTVFIKLTIHGKTENTIFIDTCESYTLNGIEYHESGTYYQTLTSKSGCDSILKLKLSISKIDPTVSIEWDKIIANEIDAEYQWLNCSNGMSPIIGENDKTIEPKKSGTFAVQVTKGGCTVTSPCISLSVAVGIDSNESNAFSVFPNPTNNKILIQTEGMHTVWITNMAGKILHKVDVSADETVNFNMSDLSAGTYFVNAESKNETATIIVVKE